MDTNEYDVVESLGEEVQVLRAYGVGIDCHSKFIQVCVLVPVAGVVRRFEHEFSTHWPVLTAARDWARDVLKKHAPASDGALTYTLESTGCYHLPVLRAFGGLPTVVNPMLAAPGRRKTDVLDARMLAGLAITGQWPASFLVNDTVQELRVIFGRRREAVRIRTRISNQVNNVLLRFGHTFGVEGSIRTAQGRAIVEDLVAGTVPNLPGVCPAGIPTSFRGILSMQLADYDRESERVKAYQKEAWAAALAAEWAIFGGVLVPGKELIPNLLTVPGVGPVTALTWLTEVVTPARFHNAKQLVAYIGFDPSLKVSAGKVSSHMRRKGNVNMHRELGQAAGALIARRREKFGQWGYALSKRQNAGGWKKACSAVGRKMALSLYYVHGKNEPFSYDAYESTWSINVPFATLEDMGLVRYKTCLEAGGFYHSLEIADRINDVPAVKGVGVKCLKQIQLWMQENSKKRRPPRPAPQPQPPSR